MSDTTEGGGPRRLITSDFRLAVALAAVVLALTAAGAHRSRLLGLERRESSDRAAVAEVSAGMGVELEQGLRAVGSAADDVPTLGLGAVTRPVVREALPGAATVGFVPLSGTLPESAGPPVLSAGDRSLPAVAELLDRARDTGEPQLGGLVDIAGEIRAPIVAAVYRAGTQPGAPSTPADRRARLAGWVVAPVDLLAVATRHAPDGAVVSVEGDGVVVGGEGARGADLAEQRLTLEGRVLHVRAGTPGGVGLTAATVALLVGGVVIAAVGAGLALSASGRLRRQRAQALHRAEQVRLIGDVAPLVQQSLDLAEVLPAVAVQLSDHFGLDGVALSTGSSRAAQTELFSIGIDPDRSVKAVLRPPEALEAGETLTLAMQRGGRSVALLQIVAGRALDGAELESLRALTELVAAAMVNASLYASQQEALTRLRELDGLKTVFLSTASHELRTPATAIAGFASLLTSSWDRFSEEQRQDFTARIAANARSLSAVVQDLLDFSLFDRGATALALTPIDVAALVESVVHRLDPVFGDHQISCSTLPVPLVAGDRNGLERVATNLLTNAVKFSPAGSTISVSVGLVDGQVAFVVSDQGPGVPPEERERVFTRFYRGSGDAVVQTRGVGIGLSVVAEFVARMHGTVAVDEAPGGGARFTVRLPVAEPELQENDDAPTA